MAETAYEAAVRNFPVGCKVETRCDRPEWSPDIHADRVVCGHVRYRDSNDDPMVCVTLVSISGAVAGWFHPDALRRIN